MLNKDGQRELVYTVTVDDIQPIPGKDRVECAVVGGWTIMVRKDQFKPGDRAIYFEIDSKVPEKEPFMFLEGKHFKIKTQGYRNPDGSKFYSQGLLMGIEDFNGELDWIYDKDSTDTIFLTKELGVIYYDPEDDKRKRNKINPDTKYQRMMNRHPKLAKSKFGRWCMKRKLAKKLLYLILGGDKKNKSKEFPVGKFAGVNKTDQERCENMTYILKDKTPFIVTQKCDGSSGTYILERKKKNKFEFYVCSRNVRMLKEDQECFFGSRNYYWEVAKKYDIENKMKDWLENHPSATFVCWQGEICAPDIQKNPHRLKDTHFYCFHWTDSINGRISIDEAEYLWKSYDMEVVPIVDKNYILPDDFEEFKKTADGFYDASVCEGQNNCMREGFVYYKTTDPTFSFKNVSRNYLLKRGE